MRFIAGQFGPHINRPAKFLPVMASQSLNQVKRGALSFANFANG